MLEEIKNIKSEKSDLRKFGITIGVILLVIAGFLLWKEKESLQIFFAISITLILTAIALPVILKPVYWLWMVFAAVIGWVMTRVILSLLFYLVFAPIGIILRMFGKQFLNLKWNHKQESYWNVKTVEPFNKKNYEKQF